MVPSGLRASASEIPKQLGHRVGGELDPGALRGVIHHEIHRRLREGAYGIRREDEADEVHGRELALLLVGVAGLELAGDSELLAHLDPHGGPHVDAHETVEDGPGPFR